MSTIKIEVQLSSEELLKAVKQLSQQDLEQFISQVLVLQAQRRTHNLLRTEVELLLKINQGITLDMQKRSNELIAKRQAETLTAQEYSELLRLTEQVEKLQAQRLECLAELARIRKISLAELMKNLGLQMPAYV